jgi:hypothetical protein
MGDKMKLKNEEILPFGDALYNGQCSECGEDLEWGANFDADGTTYKATCCKKTYHMNTNTVKITIDQKV